ncbi:MAG: Two component response regulator receiver modulated diguanylate cyclase [Solirubrobacterales bacterium]|nr:Two component response regulator receiver modulated diguanylate cyclase [Solirubrobacterales bacterium]
MSVEDQELQEALRRIWRDRRDGVLEQVTVVESAVAAALEGTLDDELRERATREAHMLAGSAGTFGFLRATAHARELEAAMGGMTPPELSELPALAEHVVALRRDLEREEASDVELPATPEAARADLLIVGGNQERAQRLVDEAGARGLRALAVAGVDQARVAIERHDPALVLLDLEAVEGQDAALSFLEEAGCPVLVVVDALGSVDRVEVARRGGRGFLPRTMDVHETVDATVGLRERLRRAGTRVLVIDDDVTVRDAARSILESEGLEVHTSDGLEDAFAALDRADPDLVVLDIELPEGRSGIDICRAMRNDRRWAATPVVVLSARIDPATVADVFTGGADDYVPKPFIGPELVGRIANRLERVRLLRELAEIDHLSGVASRSRGSDLLTGLLSLAERTGETCCIAILDCDDFKSINDNYGHAMGDAVIHGLGAELRRAFGAEDAVVRWGGDEFVVGMVGMSVEDARERVGHLLEEVRDKPFVADGMRTTVGLSAGLAVFPEDGTTVQELMQAADRGLFRAKKQGGGRVALAAEDHAESVTVDVVFVEDDPVLAALLEHALRVRGYSFRHLDDGLEAAAALASAQPQLVARVVLLDWGLPGIDGLRLLRRMAENGALQRSRVIMLTARAGESEILEALAAGAIDHVAKPFSVPVLMQRVRHALAR